MEAQYFAGSLTIDAAAGVRFGDIDSEGYARARLDYYLVEDFKLSAGFLYEGESFATAGAEFQLNPASDVGVSLFADARVHDEDSYQALAGVKFYFGERMSLINRHRKQDPDGYTDMDLLATLQAVKQNQSTAGGGGNASCPFTPAADSCDRQLQCLNAGFTFGAPGPDDCNCAGAFDSLCVFPPPPN